MLNQMWPDGPRFISGNSVFPISTDSVMLAYFTKTKRVKNAIDLGCGAGIISILLAFDNPTVTICGIDIDASAASTATENTRINGLSDRINIIHGDLRKCPDYFPAGSFDLVVSNPPYYALGRGKKASSGNSAARAEESCSLSQLCSAARFLTRWGGSFSFVHKPERLSEIFSSLSSSGFEPKRMRFVQHRVDSIPSLVLIDARRGGNPSLSILPPLILTDSDGHDSPEATLIYHR